jgi:hypothetical protein
LLSHNINDISLISAALMLMHNVFASRKAKNSMAALPQRNIGVIAEAINLVKTFKREAL